MPKIKLKEEGLEGANLAFVQELNKRFAELPEGLSRDEIGTEVRKSLGGMLDDNGKLKFDVEELSKLLGEGDSGIRSILKKQGEEITKLQKSVKGEGEKRTFKDELNKRMADIEKVFNARDNGREVRLNLRAAVTMNTGNTLTGYDDLPEDLIESFSVGAFVAKRQPREYVFDIAARNTVAEITEYKTWLSEGDEEGAFAIVAEGGLKPLVSQTLVRRHSTVSKVAAKHVVTEEFAKFRKNIYATIKRLVEQKLLRDYAAILTTRLIADAAPYTASALDDQFPAARVTDYHAIAAVAAQIEALDFVPNVLILNPQDKWRIGMSQNTEGSFYMQIPMIDPSGQPRLMGFLVRTSNRMTVGSFMLGEANLWEIEDEALTVRMGYGINVTKNGENVVTDVESDVDHNRFRVIVETYFHSWIDANNEGSFVLATFAAVKAAVTAP